jgi:hypothetical protein
MHVGEGVGPRDTAEADLESQVPAPTENDDAGDDRVRAKDSELLDLWAEANETDAFLRSADDLRRALSQQS